MNLIIGMSDFADIIIKKLGFIDKSLFIKELIDNSGIQVSVIVRPRRFGKTLNISMLRYFLTPEANQIKTKGMFDELKIAEQGDAYMQHQGKYPVIFISFKAVKDRKFNDAYEQLEILISEAYREHRYLATSDKLHIDERKTYEDILYKRASKSVLENALKELTRFLYLHHGIRPWLLIDEYDTPIQSSYLNGYYPEMLEIIRGLFGSALKDNEYLERAVITGILRIAKENLFSGLNNVKVYSILNSEYSDHFGFTQMEVDAVLEKNSLSSLSNDVKAWYNGYHIGNTQIYNPWSIANCIKGKGDLDAYWVNTSDNELIKQTMAHADDFLKMQFENILKGKPIEAIVEENITFSDLNGSGERLWTLLLFAGYLTSMQTEKAGLQKKCLLKPPNYEVDLLYRDIIVHWFIDKRPRQNYDALLKHLTTGQLEEFLVLLQDFLFHCASYFDVTGHQPEKFYHGFVMGLIVSLSETHIVKSNKESGFGRYDVMLIPKDNSPSPPLPSLRAADFAARQSSDTLQVGSPTLQKPGIILEFKVAKTNEDLQASAEEALTQIHKKNYALELTQQGINQIIKIGLAFREKEVAMAYE